jgi:hypothetical protein
MFRKKLRNRGKRPGERVVSLDNRHCEEQSDAAIQLFLPAFLRFVFAVPKLDCRASLAMTFVLPGLLPLLQNCDSVKSQFALVAPGEGG